MTEYELLEKIILPSLLDQLNKNEDNNVLIPIDLNIDIMSSWILKLIKKKYKNIVFTYLANDDNSEYNFKFNDQTYKLTNSLIFVCKKYQNNKFSIANKYNSSYNIIYNNSDEYYYRIQIINGLFDSSAISY